MKSRKTKVKVQKNGEIKGQEGKVKEWNKKGFRLFSHSVFVGWSDWAAIKIISQSARQALLIPFTLSISWISHTHNTTTWKVFLLSLNHHVALPYKISHIHEPVAPSSQTQILNFGFSFVANEQGT